jgi:hypothetical protein
MGQRSGKEEKNESPPSSWSGAVGEGWLREGRGERKKAVVLTGRCGGLTGGCGDATGCDGGLADYCGCGGNWRYGPKRTVGWSMCQLR